MPHNGAKFELNITKVLVFFAQSVSFDWSVEPKTKEVSPGERRRTLGDPRLIHFLRLYEALGAVDKVDYGCDLVLLEDIIDVEVVVS